MKRRFTSLTAMASRGISTAYKPGTFCTLDTSPQTTPLETYEDWYVLTKNDQQVVSRSSFCQSAAWTANTIA